MNCNEFRQWLEQCVEDHRPTASEQAALREHLASCPTDSCARIWDEAALLTRAVRCWRDDAPPIDLTSRVVSVLQEAADVERTLQAVPPLRARYSLVREPSPVRSARRPAAQPWGPMAMLAAALLLLVSVLTLRGPATLEVASSGRGPVQSDAAVEPSSQQDRPPVPSGELRGRLAGTYAAMPISATQFLTDAVVLVVPGDLSDPEEEPSPADVWANRLGESWEPIGRELNRSLEVLINVLPRSETAS